MARKRYQPANPKLIPDTSHVSSHLILKRLIENCDYESYNLIRRLIAHNNSLIVRLRLLLESLNTNDIELVNTYINKCKEACEENFNNVNLEEYEPVD